MCTDIPPYSWGYIPETSGIGHITEVTLYIMCNQVFFSLLVFTLGCMDAWRTKDDKLHKVLKTEVFREVCLVGQIKSYSPLEHRDCLPTDTV